MSNNSLNLPEIDQEQAFNLSKFFINSKQNFFLFGKKGVGKTAILLQAAQECDLRVNYINLSVVERSDLMGYPNLLNNDSVVTFKSPYFLPSLKENEEPNSVILFDEVDKASPEVTAPLLEILQFKKINGKPINVVACLLTGNLPEERTYSNSISTALLDRGAKYILSFSFDKWIDWGKLNNVHDLILGFLRSNPEFACSNVENTYYATPSPRGWTLASEALIKSQDLKINDLETITQIISGFVGAEAGLRFKIWYEYYRKFEPVVKVLIDSGRTTIDFKSLTPTEKIVFVITACYYAKQKFYLDRQKIKNKFSALENLCKFLMNGQVDCEVQIIGLYNSFDFGFIAKNELYECKPFFDLFTKISSQITIK